jgi:hypothetical protein
MLACQRTHAQSPSFWELYTSALQKRASRTALLYNMHSTAHLQALLLQAIQSVRPPRCCQLSRRLACWPRPDTAVLA